MGVERKLFMTYLPLALNDLYNWNLQNPKFSEKQSALIELLDSIMTHQLTWDHCQQLFQVSFTSKEREWIVGATWKFVLGVNVLPTQIQADFDVVLTRPNWD